MPRPSIRPICLVPFVAITLVVACGEPLTAPTATAPVNNKLAPFVSNSTILPPDAALPFSLAINPADLAGSFHFLEPLAQNNGASQTNRQTNSTFDASLLGSLTVKVCPAGPSVCATPLATLTSSGQGGDALKRDGTEQYKVNWKADKNANVGNVRISAEVAGLEIGAITVDGSRGNIPIKFRVNNNAVIRTRALHALGVAPTQIAQRLVDEFGLNASQVATRFYSDLSAFSAVDVAGALKNSTLQQSINQTVQIDHDLGVPAYQTAASVVGIWGTSKADPQTTADALKIAGYDIRAIMPTVSSLFQLGDLGVAELMDQIGYDPLHIYDGLHEVFQLTDVAVAAIYKTMGFDALDVLDVLVLRVGGDDPLQTAALKLKIVGYLANEIGAALEAQNCVGAKEMAVILRAIGFTAVEIANVLHIIDHFSLEATLFIMKQLNITPADVANAAKVAYGATAEQMTVAMNGVGYAAGEVASGLETAYGFTADQVAVALNGAGYAAGEVAGALKDVYGLSAAQVTAIFNDTLHLASDAISTALGAAGYAASEIGDAIEDFFGDLVDDICEALGPLC
jgi:hypothetical protein